MRSSLAIIALISMSFGVSCAPEGDGLSWDGDQLTPTGQDSLDVEARRFGDEPLRLDVPIFAASIQQLQVAADGSVYQMSGNGLEFATARFELPTPEGLQPLVLVSPAEGVVAYNLIDEGARLQYDSQVRGQRVALLRSDDETPVEPIDLQDYGVEPEAAIRSDLATYSDDDIERIYVATGSAVGGPVVPGRVFAIDPVAWAQGEEPVVAQFVVNDAEDGRCAGTNTLSDGTCGGGLHGAAAVDVRSHDQGSVEVILATGKGATDVLEGNFANGVLRLTRDLEFEPACDTSVCEAAGGASSECLSTCQNFFVPRKGAGDSGVPEVLRDTCSSAETFDCLRSAAFDGSSTPFVRSFEREGVSDDPYAWVWAAPDGFFYVLQDDWTKPSRRLKYAHVCDVDDPACDIPPHTPATTPSLWREHLNGNGLGLPHAGERVIWIATYSPIEGVPGGLSQYDLIDSDGGPALVHLRSAPQRGSPAARTRFRDRPSRVAWGAVVESGETPRFFRPFYYVNEDVRGVDIRLRTDGSFASGAYSGPIRNFDGRAWYFHVRVGDGSSVEGLRVDHAPENPILE